MQRQNARRHCFMRHGGFIGICVIALLAVPAKAVFGGGRTPAAQIRFLEEESGQPTPSPYVFTVVSKGSPTPSPAGYVNAGLTSSPTFSLQPTIVRTRTDEETSGGDTAAQAARPAIEVDLNSERETRAPFQPLKFAAVPVGFDIMLETQSRQDLDEMALEAKAILEDHLLEGFKDGFADAQGVIVRSVDLNVKALSTESTRRDRMLVQLHRSLQVLQTREITLEARGVAGFQVNRDAVDTTAFLDKVNDVIDRSVEPQTLMDLFQNSTTGLSDYRVASVTNTENPPENKKEKPTVLEMVFAFILIALAAAGLCAYAYIFWKKRQKRVKRRKQFGVGHRPPPPTYKIPPRGQPQVSSPATSSMAANNVATIPPMLSRPASYKMTERQSSSSESSYKGLGSESDEEAIADSFAKQLRLAASMDKRAWSNFERRRQELAEQGHIETVGNISLYDASSYMGAPGGEMAPDGIEMETRSCGPFDEEMPLPQSAVGLKVTGDTVAIESASSFPYGDEQDRLDYFPSTSGVFGEEVNAGIVQDSSAEGHWDSYMGAGEAREMLQRETVSGGWRMTESASSKVAAVATNRGPPQYSFIYHSEKKFESEEDEIGDIPASSRNNEEKRQIPISLHESVQTSVAVRGSPDMSNSWSTNQPPSRDTSFEKTSRSVVPALTGVETCHSSGSEDESTDGSLLLNEVALLTARLKAFEARKEDRKKQAMYGGVPDDDTNHVDEAEDEPDGKATVKVLKASSTYSLTERTSSGDSPAKQGARDTSPSEDEPGGIESIPSSDSSDIETMESDGLARRLGINPFSVQIPGTTTGPHSSKRLRITQSENEPVAIGGGEDMYLRASAGTPPFYQNSPGRSTGSRSQKSALDSLRHGDAILDDWDSNRLHHHEEPGGPVPLKNPNTITPRRRSQNSGFNKIVNKFESAAEPIFPPNESWQYNY